MAFELAQTRKRRVTPSMNVTPLVDVVLVLLIIFMVITPMMVKQMGMLVPRRDEKPAAASDPAEEPPPSIVLSVRRDGSVWLNRERVVAGELPARLTAVFSARAEKLLFFDADDDVAYGVAVSVLDQARGAGVQHIAVMTDALAGAR